MARQTYKSLIVPHPLIIEMFGIKAWEAGLKSLNHKQSRLAYCKYCYATHRNWVLSDDHFDPYAWECLLCNHFTSDEFMGK